jgi:hypothetical protein
MVAHVGMRGKEGREKNYLGKENVNLDPGEVSRDKREAGIQEYGIKLGRASVTLSRQSRSRAVEKYQVGWVT